jgi:hypothetical protein
MTTDLIPRNGSNESRLLGWLAANDWRTAREASDALSLSLNSTRSSLFALRRKQFVLSRISQRQRIDGKGGRRPSEWAVPAAVAIHLDDE